MHRRTVVALVAAAILVPAAVVAIPPLRRAVTDDRVPPPDRPCPELETGADPPVPTSREVTLTLVGTATAPTSAVFQPNVSGDGLLGQRSGEVMRIRAGRITDEVVLDLREDTQQEGDGGLLALAYDPDGGWLYVSRATASMDDVVTAYPLDDRGLPDGSAEREILRSDHPTSEQHHGGAMAFGADGMLYIGLGDGGSIGDRRDNAEDLSTELGKVLRIDPTPGAADPYRVPDDNPFVDDGRTVPEIWLYGVRNPFRMSLDPDTGDLWLGDVGQFCWEELDRLAPDAGGANLGWDRKEGSHTFEGGDVPLPEIEPTFEINHRAGWCAIVAGHVPRASAVPALDGRLLFTDYCKGQIWTLDPEDPDHVADTGLRIQRPSAIVPGPDGHPWVLSLEGDVYRIEARR